jgi:hypothetical protein
VSSSDGTAVTVCALACGSAVLAFGRRSVMR